MQALLLNPKARSKDCFRYAGAERMRNPLAGRAFKTGELVPKLIDYALKRMVLEQAQA
ncbi:MAG: hypothetical protein LBK66_00215 [Spirochaetaceae bacterium]|jgi:hypothetical protein|nr:hypothetical protein [Spirochaetaceae bacterium]